MEPNLTLDDAVRRWQALREAGSTAAVDDLCADCPEVAADLSERLRAVASMAAFLGVEPEPEPGSTQEGESRQQTPSSPSIEHPLDLPGYEMLGELGRGGMGVVYLARQLNLGRVVALKRILTRHHATPAQVARFRNEARAVAQIRHPNIVQVHDVGEHDGLPYIAFEYIRGGSLDRRLTGQPLSPEEAARFVELLARAVHAAHECGVVHRDLKPGNILLDDGGLDMTGLGVPKVTDFGLAKLLKGGSNLTMTDSVMGSPSYMAPEQAEGKVREVGPPADIYALGAILYELLTGRPPFRGASVLETLQQVKADEPAPPSRFVPGLDRDIETIALKCLEKEPSRRYTTAAALADDLDHYRRDEPIAARPVGRAERAGRWCRRNPTVAGLCGAIAASLVLGTIVSLGFALQAQAQRRAAETALANELEANKKIARARTELEEANKRETARFDLAMDAVKLFHGEVSEDLLLKEEAFEALRTKLLRGAVDFYNKLEGQLRGYVDRPSRTALSRAYAELAELTDQIGTKPEALVVHRKALSVRRELAGLPEADPSAKADVARSLLAVGLLQEATGDPGGAVASYEEARALAQDLAATVDQLDPLQALLALCHQRIGELLSATGQPAEAIASYERAIPILQRLADAHPGEADSQFNLASAFFSFASLLVESGQRFEWEPAFDPARHAYEHALEIQQKLAHANRADVRTGRILAQCLDKIGELLRYRGAETEARLAYEQERAVLQQLVNANPNFAQLQSDLADAEFRVGRTLEGSRPADALTVFGRAIAILRKLVLAHPTVTEYQGRLATYLAFRGSLEEKSGRTADAVVSLRQAIEAFEQLSERTPHDLYNLSCVHALLTGLAAKPASGLSDADRRTEAEQAMDWLRRAISSGYRNVRYFRVDPSLDPIRSRPDFQLLMLDLEMPADPFRPGD